MSNLIIMHEQQAVTSSLVVAETFGKRHDHVLRDIDEIKGVTQNWGDLFHETTYTHEQNKQQYRMFLMNRDGFTLLAMGFTGKEALHFKLKYIEAFNQMEKQGNKQLSPAEYALLQAQNMVAMERKMQEHDKRMDVIESEQKNIADVVSLNPVEWRKKVTAIINRIAQDQGGHDRFQEVRRESYELLEARGRCKLGIRVVNMQKEMALNGATKSKVSKVSKFDAIAEDARLTEIYLAIIKEMAIRYRVDVQGVFELEEVTT